MGGPLRLRPLTAEDEADARLAHEELASEDFPFLLELRDGEPWVSYLGRLEEQRQGVNVPEGWVPATFMVADVSGRIVGRLSVRHRLNDHLATVGGHVGYAVRPADRRRGHATEMLRQGVMLLRDLGVQRVLVTCSDDNAGSAATIQGCGGVFEGTVPGEPGKPAKRRYWIQTAPVGWP